VAQQLQLFGTVAATAVNTAFTNINISGGGLDVDASSAQYLMMGGIAGMMLEGSSMTDCFMIGNVKASGGNEENYIGGLAGNADGSFIVNSSVSGNVEVSGGAGNEIGGLAGSARSIINSSVSGNVRAVSTSSGNRVSAGGLVGEIDGNNGSGSAVIRKSFSTGTVSAVNSTTAEEIYAGGIAARTGRNAEITDCYSTGNVSAEGGADRVRVGGIIGSATTTDGFITIARCYASGNISAAGTISQKHAGGIAGGAHVNSGSSSTGSGSITGCAALCGSVTGGNNYRIEGGGATTVFPRTNNIAYNGMLVNGYTVLGGTDANGADKTISEIAEQVTYEALGWDFTDVWEMAGSPLRPVLQ
jgi:hypothetical protein